PPVPTAGPPGRVLVEDEVRPTDVAVIAAALEIARHLPRDRLRKRSHHGRFNAVLDLDHPAARRRASRVDDRALGSDDGERAEGARIDLTARIETRLEARDAYGHRHPRTDVGR